MVFKYKSMVDLYKLAGLVQSSGFNVGKTYTVNSCESSPADNLSD